MGFWARVGVSALIVVVAQIAGLVPNGWFWQALLLAALIGAAWNLIQGTSGDATTAGTGIKKTANWFFGIIFAPIITLGIIILVDEMSFGLSKIIWFYSSGFLALIIFVVVGILKGNVPGFLTSTELLTVLAILGIAFNWWTDHINGVVRIRLRIENGRQRISAPSFPVPSLSVKNGDLVEVRGIGSTFLVAQEFPVGGNQDIILSNKFPLGCLMPTVGGATLTDQTLMGEWKTLIEGFAEGGGDLGFDFNFPKSLNPATGAVSRVRPDRGDMRLRIAVNRSHSAGPERLDRKLKNIYWGVFGKAITLRGENASSERVNLENLSEAFPNHYMGIKGPDEVVAHISRDKEWIRFSGPKGRKVILSFKKKNKEEIRNTHTKKMKIVDE